MDLAEGHNAVFYLVNIQIIPTAYKFFTMINKIYNTIIKNYNIARVLALYKFY